MFNRIAPPSKLFVYRPFTYLQFPGSLRNITTAESNSAKNFSLLDFFKGHYSLSAAGGVPRGHQLRDVHQLVIGQPAKPIWKLALVMIQKGQTVQVSDSRC